MIKRSLRAKTHRLAACRHLSDRQIRWSSQGVTTCHPFALHCSIPFLPGYRNLFTSSPVPCPIFPERNTRLPDTYHTASEALPFIRFRELVQEPNTHAGTLFDSIHPTAKARDRRWPRQYLEDIFSRRSEPRTIIRLFTILAKCVPDVTAQHAVRLIISYARKLGKQKIMAGLPAVVDLFLDRMDQSIKGSYTQADVPVLNEVLQHYDNFLGTINHFANPTGWTKITHDEKFQLRPLPEPVLQEAVRIAERLLALLDKLPSSSEGSNRPRLDTALLQRLFSPRYLSPKLRDILLDHAKQRRIRLSPWHWHQCFLSFMAEGDTARASHFRKLKWDPAELETGNSGNMGSQLSPSPLQTVHSASGLSYQIPHQSLRYRAQLDASPFAIDVADLVQSRGLLSTSKLIQKLEPYLNRKTAKKGDEAEEDDLLGKEITPFAWSKLLSRVAKDQSIKAEELLQLLESMPEHAVIGHTLTPVMQGLMNRGEDRQAWLIWRDLIAMAKNADRGDEGRYFDNASLSAGSEACYRVSNFAGAITLVDSYARRPVIRRSVESGLKNSLTLDTQNVNVLLRMCQRDGLASVAFRLWAAALPRWNVYLNEVSLGLLMDTAKYCESRRSDYTSRDLISSFRRLRNEISPRRTRSSYGLEQRGERYSAYDADGFAKGSVSVLLDSPEYSWDRENGGLRPWQLARDVFRDVVLGNWPYLADVKSPLDLQTGLMPYLSPFFAGQYQPVDLRKRRQMPSEHARYTHIIPTPVSFYVYISLIGDQNLTTEIPMVLAWMKELDIRPTWKTMCWAMLYIADTEGPSRLVTGWGSNGQAAMVRDSQILRRWLVDWVGDRLDVHEGAEPKGVPTEEDVIAFRRVLMSKNKKLIVPRT